MTTKKLKDDILRMIVSPEAVEALEDKADQKWDSKNQERPTDWAVQLTNETLTADKDKPDE